MPDAPGRDAFLSGCATCHSPRYAPEAVPAIVDYVVAVRAASRPDRSPLRARYCADCAQNPLMHLSCGLQQSAAVLHLSDSPEQLGGWFEQMSAPASPFGSQ
jgi:hypothetical protein